MENNYNTLNLNNIQNTNNLNNIQNQDNTAQALNVQVNNIDSQGLTYADSASTTVVNPVVQPNPMQQVINEAKADLINTVTTVNPVNTQNTVVTESTTQTEVKTENKEENKEPVVMNSLKIKTEKIQQFLTNASKISINNTNQPLSQVLQLKFSEEGFEIICGNGADILIQKDTSVRFTEDISIGISNTLFTAFISKVMGEYIELSLDKDAHIINVFADNGIYKFAERYDISTGEELHFPINEKFNDIQTFDFDLAAFKKAIAHAVIYSGNQAVDTQLSGVYCNENICATDKYIFEIENNLQELKNYQFYIAPSLINIITQVNFGNNAKIGFGKEMIDGVPYNQYIKIESDEVTLLGYCKDFEDFRDYPLEGLNNLKNIKYDTQITFSRTKLLNDLEKAALFIPMNDATLLISTELGYIVVQVDGGYAASKLPVQNSDKNIAPFKLEAKSFITTLKDCTEETLCFLVDENNKDVVGILAGERKIGLSIIN